MISINTSVGWRDRLVSMETLDFCYPFSLVKVRYDVGQGIKEQYGRIGFNNEGQLTLHTKNFIHKDAQKLINSHLLSIRHYITKWNQLN